MIVILNPSAGGGKASAKWRRIEPVVRGALGDFELVTPNSAADASDRVREALEAGERDFVAAGGDGTVSLLVGALLEHASRAVLSRVRVGAIGLGSSNDFHKPILRSRGVADIPLKLNFAGAVRHDVGLVRYRDEAGTARCRSWIVNASIGTTAEANRFFNAPDPTLSFLKRHLPGWAIVYAALRTIVRFRGSAMTMVIDGGHVVRARVKNLGVVKNPHFTGALRYDSPYEPNSGRFHVHLLDEMSLLRVARVLSGLLRGKSGGYDGARSWRARELCVESDATFAVEGDGEVVMAKRAEFSLLPGAIQVCA